MDAFNLRDFDGYFRNSWIRAPDGDVAQVMGVVPAGLGEKQHHLVMLSKSGGKNDIIHKPLSEIDWKNVGMPSLGYRNFASYGKGLVYLIRHVGRVTHKGLSENTTTISAVPYVMQALQYLGLETKEYTSLIKFNAATANEAFSPTFNSLEEAIRGLNYNPKATGYALSNDFALVLGTNKHNTYVLLWKQKEAACSPDGRTWTLYSKDYKDIIDRRLGRLNYE